MAKFEERVSLALTSCFNDPRRHRRLIGHKARTFDFQFHPTEHCAVSASEDCTARVWDLTNGRCLKTLQGKGKKAEVLRVCWAPSGADRVVLATGSADGTVRLWGIPRNNEVKDVEDNTVLGQCSALKIMGQLRHRDHVKGLDGQIYTCQFVNDGRGMASGNLSTHRAMDLLTASDSSVHLWDVTTRQRKVSRALSKVGSHSIGGERNPDDLPFVFDAKPRPGSGSCPIAVALSDGTVRVGDILGDPGHHHVLKPEGSNTHLTALAWSEDGAALVSCAGDGSMTVWDARTWTARAVLCGHTRPVYGATFSPSLATSASGEGSGQLLLSWSSDETIRTWDVSCASYTGTSPLSTLSMSSRFPIFHCALSTDGGHLAVAGGDSSSTFVGVPIKLVEISEEVLQGK